MSADFLNDIRDLYINEVIKPQLGKATPPRQAPSAGSAPAAGGVKKVEKGKDDAESSAKRIRQAVYDIRYRARRENIKLDQAFNQYMAHTNMSSSERNAVKEKLGMTSGSVSEEYIEEAPQRFKVRVSDKQSRKAYIRYATRSKIQQLRKNPNISSVEMTGYGEPYEGEKAKGKATADVSSGKGLAKKDYDGDGKIESGSKEHAGSVHNAIQKAKGGVPDGQDTRKKVRKESFSNWRSDLVEIVNDTKSSETEQVKEKKVNNYSNKTVVINPEIKENIQIIEMVEIEEDFLIETSEIATEYFISNGLNEEGLDIVIEELGLEKFTDFVFYVAEDYNLTEARAGGVKVEPVTKSGKSVGSLKGGAKSAAIARLRREKAARKEAEAKSSSSKQSGMTAALKSQSSVAKKVTTDKGKKAVEKAKATQGSKKPVRDAIARGVFGAVKAYQQGMKRHRAATQTAGKALKVAAKGASEFGKGVASGVKTTAKVAQAAHKVLKNSYEYVDEAKKMKGEDPCWKNYEMVGTKKKNGKEVPNCVPKEEYDLQEVSPPGFKGTVKAMKKHGEIDNPFALAWYMKKKGYKSHKKASGAPKIEEVQYVDEAISKITGNRTRTGSTQRKTEMTQVRNSQKEMSEQSFEIGSGHSDAQKLARQQGRIRALEAGATTQGEKKAAQSKLKGPQLPLANSYELNGEVIDERRKEDKVAGTPRKPRDKAFELVAKSMGSGRFGVQPRGQKKVPGKKPPAAGEYGGPASPAQKVAKRRADAQRAQDMMHSRFD